MYKEISLILAGHVCNCDIRKAARDSKIHKIAKSDSRLSSLARVEGYIHSSYQRSRSRSVESGCRRVY